MHLNSKMFIILFLFIVPLSIKANYGSGSDESGINPEPIEATLAGDITNLVIEAIAQKNAKLVKELLQTANAGESLRQEGVVNKTSISHLVAENDFAEFLTDNELRQFYDPLALDTFGQTPTCYAAKAKGGEFFEQLLKIGDETVFTDGNCSYAGDHLGTPLHAAFYYNQQKLAASSVVYLDKREAVLRRDSKGYTLLHVLAMNNKPETEHATKVLALHISELDDRVVEARDKKGRTPFLAAALHGSPSFAELLRLDMSADPSAVDNAGFTAAHLTSSRQFVDYLLKLPNARFDINTKTPREDGSSRCKDLALGGMTPLHVAVNEKKPIFFIKFLLNYKADVTAVNQCGFTALGLAVHVSYTSTVRLLLDYATPDAANYAFLLAADRFNVPLAKMIINEAPNGIGNVDILMDPAGSTPLYLFACHAEVNELTGLLIQKGANTTLFQNSGLTALHRAIKEGNFVGAKIIIQNDRMGAVNLAAKDSLDTPLHLVAKSDFIANDTKRCAVINELTTLLIEKGADLSLFNKDGLTPILEALRSDNFDAAKLMVQNARKSAINLATEDSLDTPLHLVANFKFISEERRTKILNLTSLLIEKEADLSLFNEAGLTPLLVSLKNSNFDAAKLIIAGDHVDSVSLPSKDSLDLPLHIVAKDDTKFEFVQSLILKGADICQLNKEGYTPLHLAILGSAVKNSLAIANSSQNLCSDRQMLLNLNSALHLAAKNAAFLDVLKLLVIEKGANVMLKNGFGQTALHIAIVYGNIEGVKFLLEREESPLLLKATDKTNRSALHLAVRNSQVDSEVARLVIKSAKQHDLTSSLIEKDALGDTPLHRAVFHQSLPIVMSLLEIESCSVFNNQGQTPLHVAIKMGYYDMAHQMMDSGKCSPDQENSCGIPAWKIDDKKAKVLGCGEVPIFANGVVEIRDSCPKSTGTITCNKGFVLLGSPEITCTEEGKWRISGFCEDRTCDSLPTIQNGKLSGDSSMAPGAKRTITCDRDFQLAGSAEIACSDVGTWVINGTCRERFFITTAAEFFSKPEEECGKNARLAIIRNDEDQDFACRLLRSRLSGSFWLGSENTRRAAIGLSRRTSQYWTWEDGSSATKTYWLPGEPNNSKDVETCAELKLQGKNCGWNDIPDYREGIVVSSDAYLCEYI